MPVFYGDTFFSTGGTSSSTLSIYTSSTAATSSALPIYSSSAATMTTSATTGAMSPSLWHQVQGQALMQQSAMQQAALLQQAALQQQAAMQQFNVRPAPTPDELARIERERERGIQETAAYARARAEATARARALLLSFLSPEQRADFEAAKWFIVIGKSGTRYRIRRGHIGNVDVMRGKSGDYVVHRLCFHPDNDRELPVYDTMLAQMLHLRADDAAARRIANVS